MSDDPLDTQAKRIEAIEYIAGLSTSVAGEFVLHAEMPRHRQDLVDALSALGVSDQEMMAAGVEAP